ncbi:MAG TPA: hypothetical protein VM687_00830 [Stenotrophomonas sp.]|nr:hypothetical protein [Stenotrophomonas sp.]
MTGKRTRWPAYVLCLQWAVGAYALGCTAWWGELGAAGLLICGLMAVAAIALVGWFGGYRWGPRLAIWQWALQVPLLGNDSFDWFLWFGLQLHVKASIGDVTLGLNLYALVMLLGTLNTQRQASGRSDPVEPATVVVAARAPR